MGSGSSRQEKGYTINDPGARRYEDQPWGLVCGVPASAGQRDVGSRESGAGVGDSERPEFTSPTLGRVTFSRMFRHILEYVQEEPEYAYNLIIGTDSLRDEK